MSVTTVPRISGRPPSSDFIVSVGDGGQFKTIQSAIDFAQTRDAFILADTSIDGDYGIAFASTFKGWAVKQWDQNGSKITYSTTVSAMPIYNIRQWIKHRDEDFYYKIGISSERRFGYSDMRRIDATILNATDADAIGDDFDIWKENTLVINLLDKEYKEDILITSDICVKFYSENNSVLSSTSIAKSFMSKTSNFKNGVIEFFGCDISAQEGVFMKSIDWPGINTIDLRFENCILQSMHTDLMSPAILIGAFSVLKCQLISRPTSGLSHYFYFLAQGTCKVIQSEWNCWPVGGLTPTSEGDLLLFDSTEARLLIVDSLSVNIDGSEDKCGALSIVRGLKYTQHVQISNITIVSDAFFANQGLSNTVVADVTTQAGGAQTPVALSEVFITNVKLLLPNAIDRTKIYLFRGEDGNAANANITDCNDGRITLGDSDVCNNLNYDVIQSVPFAASITPNANLGNKIDVGELTSAITINAPTSPQTGQRMRLLFTQNGTGNFAITFNAVFKAQVLTAGGANTKVVYDFEYDGVIWLQANTAQWL